MIKQIILRIVLYGALAYAFCLSASKPAKAESLSLRDNEPKISIYQGTEKGTSVLVLQWPNGKIERLVFKDSDKQGYLLWFNERLDSHEGIDK